LIYHQNVINKNLQLAEKNKMFVCVATWVFAKMAPHFGGAQPFHSIVLWHSMVYVYTSH
jgi:hypothetical protein